jgi:signal transduction histidine kinase
VLLDELSARFGPLPSGPWPESAESALVLPIGAPGQSCPAGFLVLGLRPRQAIDAAYCSFCDLVAGHVATALANARAYEEERKRAEALAQIDRVKTAFFSNVSHEFRTPLTLMLGPLENLLSKGGSLSGEHRNEIETAHRNSLRLLKLVNSLLDFSRIEAGRIKASYEPVELSALTGELAANFRSAIEAVGLRLIVDCQPLPQPVYVDRDMWEKIVLNLLSNAFKFTFEGSITVRLKAHGDSAVLTVSDTGTGIAEHELPHIFERFHRIENAKGRNFEGSGIGLALIQEYAMLHGGSVQVSSRIDEGSTFTVRLPFGSGHLAAERVAATAAETSEAARAGAFAAEALTWLGNDLSRPAQKAEDRPARARILLADDNADMREHIIRILGDSYDVRAVPDGQAALQAAREQEPDLILSDIMMPVLDGFGMMREIRADPALREIPVILGPGRGGGPYRRHQCGRGRLSDQAFQRQGTGRTRGNDARFAACAARGACRRGDSLRAHGGRS